MYTMLNILIGSMIVAVPVFTLLGTILFSKNIISIFKTFIDILPIVFSIDIFPIVFSISFVIISIIQFYIIDKIITTYIKNKRTNEED